MSRNRGRRKHASTPVVSAQSNPIQKPTINLGVDTTEEKTIQKEIKKQEKLIADLEMKLNEEAPHDEFSLNSIDDGNADSEGATLDTSASSYEISHAIKLETTLNRVNRAIIEEKIISQIVNKPNDEEEESTEKSENNTTPNQDVPPGYFQRLYQWFASSLKAILDSASQFIAWIGSKLFPAAQPAPAQEVSSSAAQSAPAQTATSDEQSTAAQEASAVKTSSPATPKPFFDEKKAARLYFAGSKKPNVSNMASAATLGFFAAGAEAGEPLIATATPELSITAESKSQDNISANEEVLAIENDSDTTPGMNLGS